MINDFFDFGSSEAYAIEGANESAIKKPKRLTSVVWNHFERVRKADICYAICVHCNKKLSGSSNGGTTHLRSHLMRAKKEVYIKPTIIKYEQEQRKDEILNLGSGRFDKERNQLDLACMIVLRGYPLAMIEHVGFKNKRADLENRPRLSNRQLLDASSAAHVLNSIVRDAMEALQLPEKLSSWLSYPMEFNIHTAVEYRNAFCHLPELDPDFASSDEEWEWASSINSYLKLFIEIINVFSGSDLSGSSFVTEFSIAPCKDNNSETLITMAEFKQISLIVRTEVVQKSILLSFAFLTSSSA
ncbi:hypothetical protein DITRI_Ditri02bG0172400 [Diplodiscus trichospermus]